MCIRVLHRCRVGEVSSQHDDVKMLIPSGTPASPPPSARPARTRRRCGADGSHGARARAGMFVLLLDGSLMPDGDDEEDEEKEGEDEQPDNEPEDDVWVEQAVLALALSRRCSRFPIVACHTRDALQV